MLRISVHIVTYNSAHVIETCLESVIQQQGADFDILVIDNASQDDTVERVKRMGVDMVRNKTNSGYAAAHNQAIMLTQSEYVLTLNPDVWLDPDFLRAMVAALDRNPRVGSAAGCLLRVNYLGSKPLGIDSTGLIMTRARRQKLRDENIPINKRPAYYTPIFGPDGAAAFYRRAMLQDINVMGEVFDSDFFMHKEDVDVCWRAQLRGWGSIYVPGAVAHHIRGFRPGQRGRVSQQMRFYGVRNRYLLMLKNETWPHFLRDIWAIGFYDLGILLYILLRERQSIAAYRSVRELYPRMIEKRRIIQSRRTVRWRDIRRAFKS
jgi:GT2 family glycosyltransferase